MLKQRIDILQQGKIISEEAADLTKNTIDLLKKEYPQMEDENAVMFTTHLAMAAQRVINKDEEHPLDPLIMEQIRHHQNYTRSCEMVEKIKGISKISFPDTELEFLVVHLCNVFTN